MDTLEALKSRLDLLDLAREYLRDLKRAGKSWVALCPFHEEKTPSLHINPERGLFYCFGCAAGGDALRFYMSVEKLSFKEAVDALCQRYGVPRPKFAGSVMTDKEQKLKKDILQAMELARNFFRDALAFREDPFAERARHFVFQTRKLSPETVKAYSIGLAPMGNNALLTTLVSKKGVEPRVLEKAGLAAISSRDARYCDFFRSRVVFPVLDLNSSVIAFGGRILSSDTAPVAGPKYLNSPDTLLFKKSDTLYGLAQHKDAIRQKNKCYVVEGYFDTVTLAQAGLPYAVSPMGGSLSASHVRLIKRFASNVFLLFDPDAAGMNSAIRAGRLLLAQELAVRVLPLPSGMDPDEFVLKYGKETFEALETSGSQDFLDFEVATRLKGSNVGDLSLSERLAVSREAMGSLLAIPSESMRREALLRLAAGLKLDPIGLERELYATQGRDVKNAPIAKQPVFLELTPEDTILSFALENPEAVRQALENYSLTAGDFSNAKIARFIFSDKPEGVDEDDASWQELVSKVTLCRNASGPEELDGALNAMKREKFKLELKSLRAHIETRRRENQSLQPELLRRVAELEKNLKRKANEADRA